MKKTCYNLIITYENAAAKKILPLNYKEMKKEKATVWIND